eukprot:Trichotokara_eunicae@DN2322_c0_g1_i1.p1
MLNILRKRSKDVSLFWGLKPLQRALIGRNRKLEVPVDLVQNLYNYSQKGAQNEKYFSSNLMSLKGVEYDVMDVNEFVRLRNLSRKLIENLDDGSADLMKEWEQKKNILIEGNKKIAEIRVHLNNSLECELWYPKISENI